MYQLLHLYKILNHVIYNLQVNFNDTEAIALTKQNVYKSITLTFQDLMDSVKVMSIEKGLHGYLVLIQQSWVLQNRVDISFDLLQISNAFEL